jgi:hypothetical protein
MNETEATYRQLLRERDQKRLQDFMDTPDEEVLDEPPAPPKIEEKKAKESVLGAGVTRTGETAKQSLTHFMRGIDRIAQSTVDPDRSGVESLYGFGEVVLGGLTLAISPLVGAGAALKQAMVNYVPGLEKSVAIPGGKNSVAGPLRFALGLPSFLLDPEIHKIIRGDPKLSPEERIEQREALMQELQKDVTYGEIMEALVMFAVPSLVIRGMKPRGAALPKTTPEPLVVQEAAGIRALAQEAGPSAPGGGFPPTVTRKWQGPKMTPEDMATRAEALVKEVGEKEVKKVTPVEGAAKAEEGALKVEEAGREPFVEEEFAPAAEEWTTQVEVAVQRAEAVILEEVAKDPELAAVIKKTIPKEEPPSGEVPSEVDKVYVIAEEARLKREQIASRSEAADEKVEIAQKAEDDAVNSGSKDVPKLAAAARKAEVTAKKLSDELESADRAWGEAHDVAFRLKAKESGQTVEEPPAGMSLSELADMRRLKEDVEGGGGKAEILAEDQAAIAKLTEEMRGAKGQQPSSRGKGEAKSPKLGEMGPLGGERGSIDPNLLARMAVGAAIGGVSGDTAEERVKYALLGMLGGAIAPRVAKRFIGAMKTEAPRLLDPTTPRVPSFERADVTKTTNTIIDRVAGKERKLTERILSLEEADTITLEETRLGHRVEMNAWAEVKRLADAYGKGEPVPPGELREAMALARILNDQITHSGRRMGATGTRGLEKVKVAVGRVNRLAREWDQTTPEATIAAVLRETGSIEELGHFIRLYYAIPEALTQTMYGSMLLGKALVKNAVGNAAMAPISIMDRSFASLKYRDPAYTLGVAQQGVLSLWEGVLDQMRMIRKWDELGEQARAMGSTHVEVGARGWEALAEMSEDAGHPGLAKGLDYINSASGLAPEIMSRTDGMSKAVHGQMAIAWEAMERARSEGLRAGTQEFWDRVQHYKDNFDELGSDALLRVKEHRDHMTFTRQIESELVAALQAGPTDPWLNLLYRMTILPFVRTPVRLYDVGAEYTPGINLMSAQFRREMRAGGTRRTVAEARLATGTLAIGSFMYLAMQGYITGSMPDDPKEAKAMSDAGRPPISWWDPLAQKYRSYKGIEPLTQWISTGSDLAAMIGRMPEVDAERLITAASLAITNNINVTQFMQAMSEMIDVMKNGRTDSQWEQSLEFIRRRLTVFVPAIAKELTGSGKEKTRTMLSTAFDEDRSPWAGIHREMRALLDDYRKGFGAQAGPGEPYIKKVRNMWTGDPLINDVWPFNPFTTVPAKMDPWAREVTRLKGAGVQPIDEWMGRPQAADIGLEPRRTAPGVRLTAPQLDRLEVLMTQEVKVGGKKLTESLDALVTSPAYQRFPDFTKQDLIQERWDMFRQSAEQRLLLEDKTLRSKFALRRGESIVEKLPSTRQPQLRENLHRRFGPNVAP